MIPRVFVSLNNVSEKTALIEGSDVNYLKNVLRLSIGAEIRVLDSKSKEYSAVICSMSDDKINVELTGEKHPKSEPKIKVTIAHGIPKNPKMDLIVQKSTELGAVRIIPIKTERSIVKINPDKEDNKVARWQRIAKEAAEQSGRLIIPTVEGIMNYKDLFAIKSEFDLCLMLWEMEKERTIKAVFQENKTVKRMLILIGPEGGFSHEEAETAKCEGFITASLGSRIVRTETASMSALSMFDYEYEL
jgi:16S rRNA (uracil1498-N3)-methyltransferase